MKKDCFIKICALTLLISSFTTDSFVHRKGDIYKSEYQIEFEKGDINQLKGYFPEAINNFTRAYAFLEKKDVEDDKLDCLKRLGILYWTIGEVDRSITNFNIARQIEERIGISQKELYCKTALEIISLYNKGKEFREEGRVKDSLEIFDEAIKHAKEIKSDDFELKCVRQKSISYWLLDDEKNFYLCNEIGLKLANKIGHQIEVGRCLNNIGIYYEANHNYTIALKYFTSAIDLARKHEDESILAESLNNIGLLFSEVGEHEKAISYLNESLKIDQEYGSAKEAATTAINIGSVYIEKYLEGGNKEDLFTAIAYLRKCFEISKDKETEIIRSSLLNNLGVAYYELGEYERAFSCYTSAIEELGDNPYIEEMAGIYTNLGFVYFKQEDVEKAKYFFNKSLYMFPVDSQDACRWETYFGLGNCYQKSSEISEAIKYYERAIECIEKINVNISFDLFKIGFIKGKYQAYEQLIYSLYEVYKKDSSADNLKRMLFNIEKAKAQIFLETLIKANMRIQGQSQNYFRSQHNINYRIPQSLNEILASSGSIDPINNLQRPAKPTLYNRKSTAMNMELHGVINNGLMDCLDFNTVLNNIIKKDTVYLEYWLGDSKSFLIYQENDAINMIELPSRFSIEYSVRGYLKAIAMPPKTSLSINQASERIANELLASVLNNIDRSVNTVVIAPDGILNYLPFEALLIKDSNKKKYLIEKYRVSYITSMTVLYYLETCWEQKNYKKNVLGLGAPTRKVTSFNNNNSNREFNVFALRSYSRHEENLSVLPFSKIELKNIAKNFKANTCDIYIGKEATTSIIKGLNLDEYKIIHFACHGICNEKYPLDSAMVLSNTSNQNDMGYLFMKDIYDLRMSAELVILSACNTAGGKVELGAGIVSISRAFFAAGARSVLASLWTAKDRTATIFMNKYYKELLRGKSKMDALRETKNYMISSNRKNPYYWAGFILYGEYNTAIIKGN